MKNKEPLSLSNNQKRQLIILDTLEACIVSLPPGTPKKTKDVAKRIMIRNKNIIHLIIPEANRGRLDGKIKRQYHRIMESLKTYINKSFPDTIDMVLYFNTLLCLTEDIRRQIPKQKKAFRREWDALARSLNTLYRHYDPDLTGEAQMIRGEFFAGKLQEIIETA